MEDSFQNAVKFVRLHTGKFEPNDLLYLYGRYKQVTEGRCKTQKPGWFDFQGKAKWEAWNGLADANKDDCMLDYVAKVAQVQPEWQTMTQDGGGGTDKLYGMGTAVSCMSNPDDFIDDKDKTIYDWLKEGNSNQVTRMITSHDINSKDEEGLTLLHWACDRGFVEMVQLLLQHGASINLTDNDDQTPLHYAVCCEHTEVVRLLLDRGADATLCDSDGYTPVHYTDHKSIVQLFDT